MANIEGVNDPVPGAYTNIETQTAGVSVPGGSRLAAILGEGARSEVLVSTALGGGLDGLNSAYTSTTGADGRHFKLTFYPIISNRTVLYRNGIPLIGLEEVPDDDAFDNAYDYRIDIATGEIELQAAHLVDQGGLLYKAGSQNFGEGEIKNLTIVDENAPTETWTIKCASVQRDGYGEPITETAKFIAFGTVSGAKLDGYGNPIIWNSDNAIVSNGILSFSVYQDPDVSANTLKEGDTFTVKVASGVLLKSDSLTASYIAVAELNDPTFFETMNEIAKKHGSPSTDNNLSLGSLIAFSNSTPGVVCVQTMPSVPRRSNFELSDAVAYTSTDDESFIFPLPVNVTPDVNSSIHFFTTNPTTGIEKQILPNKVTYYSVSDTSTTPTLTDFINDTDYGYDYTVIERPLVTKFAADGTLTSVIATPGTAVLSSPSFTFGSSDIGKLVRIENADEDINIGEFDVVGVTNGNLELSFPHFVNDTALTVTIKNAAGNTIASFGDGVITRDLTDGTKAVLGSASTDFSAIATLTSKFVHITIADDAGNNGKFLISGLGVDNFKIVIKKYFITETPITFELYDPDSTGSFVVVNKSVLANANGHGLRVTLIDERDVDFYDVGWVQALEALEKIDVDIIVPLPKQTISAIFQNTVAHCRTMSNTENKRERVAFVGAISGLEYTHVLGDEDAAVEDIGILEGIQGHVVADILSGNTEDLANYDVYDAFGSTYRAVYFYPDEIVVQAGAERVAVNGFYMAAAAAGYLCSVPNVAVPLTNKVLTGFTILKTKLFSPSVLKRLVAHGITVLQPVTGGGRVIQGKTTTNSGFPEEEEISIIFIRDKIAKSMRAGFEGFIGLPENDSLLGTLTSRAVGLLNSYVASGLITSFDNLRISRDTVDPRQWNVAVRVQPVYPVNWIYIKVGVGIL